MNKHEITLKKLNGLNVNARPDETNRDLVAAMNVNLLSLGYCLSRDVADALTGLDTNELGVVYSRMVETLKTMVGSHVRHKPMYVNFPKYVREASDVELHVQACLHYWTMGEWMPEHVEQLRESQIEFTNLTEIRLVSDEEFHNLPVQILSSNDSISDYDKEVVGWFLDNYEVEVPEIPFKENLCLVGADCVHKRRPLDGLVGTATDVLRIATHLSGGDVSLSQNTKFRSFRRAERRILVNALDKVVRTEDLQRHDEKWVRLAHGLHVGDYSRKVYDCMKKVRENRRIKAFNGIVDEMISNGNVKGASKKLVERPGEFVRRLDDLLVKSSNDSDRLDVLDQFFQVADRVPTRLLTQLFGHFKNRNTAEHRYVLPKGSTQKAILLDAKSQLLDQGIVDKIINGITLTLQKRFSDLDSLGKVYLNPDLMNCPLPSQQRSASDSLFTVARGTRIPVGDKSTLRFFIYWVGQDIDLSASFHNEDYDYVDHVSYTNLRDAEIGSYHSGDIVRAPAGASEFIDVDMDAALKAGMRYVVMNVLVYAGPNFADHDECFAGWMTRDHVDSNEIFEPTTVKQKADLTSQSKNAIPVIFDLKTREAVWCDLATKERHWGNHIWRSGNNIEGNKATVRDMLKFCDTMTERKMTLHDLLTIHASARGEIVDDPEQADVIFDQSFAYSINTINGEYLV